MVLEKDSDENVIKGNQAISSDYSDTGYDCGHLNPNSFQCGEGRTATCTLTNAAPMDACFNHVHWKRWETTLRSFLLQKLVSVRGSATAYIVTGTVPNATERIPQKGTSGDSGRVTVPSHIWTAVCYKHHTDDTESFSFSFMGRNQLAEPGISLMRVSNLNDRLSELYSEQSKTPQLIKIFVDDCGEDNNKLNMIQERFQKLINLPVNQGVQMSPDVQNTFGAVKRAVSSDSISSKSNVEVRKMTSNLACDSMHDYYTVKEELKAFSGSSCLLTHAKSLVIQDELGKREVSEGSDAVECPMVPEKHKTAADGSPCLSISGESCQCTTGGEIKTCCSSPCLYDYHLKVNMCYSGQTQILCSPTYSVITYKGKRCLDDYPCATYGLDYYWCWTGSFFNNWDYCSPPLYHSKAKNGKKCRSNNACAKYGSRHKWCYTDDEGNWDYCCTSDDCLSAVNDKKCSSNNHCGYYGHSYLWCFLDDNGNWDYCCTDCP